MPFSTRVICIYLISHAPTFEKVAAREGISFLRRTTLCSSSHLDCGQACCSQLLGVGEERRHAAGVEHDHRMPLLDEAPSDEVLKTDQRLAGVDGIEEDAFRRVTLGERGATCSQSTPGTPNARRVSVVWHFPLGGDRPDLPVDRRGVEWRTGAGGTPWMHRWPSPKCTRTRGVACPRKGTGP